MKKLLTVLLTIVMAACLINLNNSHTKAEDNANYTWTWNGGSWSNVPQSSYNKGDKITLVKSSGELSLSINGGSAMKVNNQYEYTVKANTGYLTFSIDSSNVTVWITDNDTSAPVSCNGISFDNGVWKDGATDITASLSNYGIEYNATTKVAKFSKSLTASAISNTVDIKSPLTIEIVDNISITNTRTDSPGSTAIAISDNDVVIDGKNHTLKASSNGGVTVSSYLYESSIDLTLKNITLDCDNSSVNDTPSATISAQRDLILQGNCLIEAINNGQAARALQTGGAVKFNNDAITTKKEGNIAGKGQPLKAIEKNASNVYEFDNSGTPTIAKYIRIEQKVPTDPLTFTAKQAGSTVTFKWISASSVSYKTNDMADWAVYNAGTPITLTNVGDTVSFKGTNVITDYSNHFSMTGDIAASGDVNRLTSNAGGDITLSANCYKNMFYNCTALTSISNLMLPSTTLADDCYNSMFAYCTGLTTIPADLLPATGLASGCYQYMFGGCSNLVNMPNLPALTLANWCYSEMFEYCSNLKLSETKTGDYTIPYSIPKAGVTAYVQNCTYYMFNETGGTYTGNPIMSGDTRKQLYVAGDTTSSKTSSECAKDSSTNISITTGSDTQAEVKLVGLTQALTAIKLNSSYDLVKGSDYSIFTIGSTDGNAVETVIRLSKLFISTLPVGLHEVKLVNPEGTWTININIVETPAPSPSDPSKKDESCEKVIGPTWHWNNDKGICEDIGVVGTATR